MKSVIMSQDAMGTRWLSVKLASLVIGRMIKTSWDRVPAVELRNILEHNIHANRLRSTQPVKASEVDKSSKQLRLGLWRERRLCVIPYDT